MSETHVSLQEPRYDFYDGDKAGQQTERALLFAQLVAHPGWALLVETVAAAAEPYENILVSGRAADYPEYREKAGYLRALRYVLSLPTNEQTLAREMERDAAQRRTDADS